MTRIRLRAEAVPVATRETPMVSPLTAALEAPVLVTEPSVPVEREITSA